MICSRRISATYKDLPGGQILGPTYDYTHRLLDFKLIAEEEVHNIQWKKQKNLYTKKTC